MAEKDRSGHISETMMKRFSVRTLRQPEFTNVAEHLTECRTCQAEFVSTLKRQREGSDLSFTLAPEFWLRHEHLDYEQLVDLADNRLDTTDRELIDVHLKVCPPCQEDVQSLLAFREKIAPELRVSYAPIEKELAKENEPLVSWWRGLGWKPIYSAALVAIGIALVIGAAILLNRGGENKQAQQVPTPQASPASSPDTRTANLPAPPESPTEKPTSAEAVVLSDQGRTITVDKGGNVFGLDDVPAPTRDEIAQVLLSERIKPPAILKELRGQESPLRGTTDSQPFKLISPARSVIISDRPTLKWESVSGASAYRIYISDSNGNIVAKSDELTPGRREWIVPKPLSRGEVYAWTAVAIVDNKEIISPGPASPEMKFQILSRSSFEQMEQLKRTRSHLALGIFYAKVGLMVEAEREFQGLVRLNPNSKVSRHLLRSSLSLRGKN